MPATFDLGDNYTIREDSNGDYELEHDTLGFVLRFDSSENALNIIAALSDLDISDLVDGASGNVVYDSSTETFGDSNQDADLDTVTSVLTDTDSVKNQDYNESVNTIANASGTTDIDLSLANWHEIEADGDITISFSNVSSAPPGNSVILYFEDDDSTGPHTITWPGSVVWSEGNVIDTIEVDSDVEITLRSPDGGTTWRASRSGRRFS